MKGRFCFVTLVDLNTKGDGAVTTDQQMLRCLAEFGDVDVIFLKKTKYRSAPLALVVFFFQILKSFSKPYNVYFSRGVITSLLLVSFNMLRLRKRKIVQRALSVPLGSKEVKFLKFGKIESFFRYSLFLFLEHLVYSHINFVTVAAELWERELIEAGVRRDKIHVVSFVAGKEFFGQPLKGKVNGAFRFCYVGGFHLYQDLLPVLEAFETVSKTNRNVDLLFVGDGPQRPRLEEEATKRKLCRAKFVGKVSHSTLPTILSKIDCFISLTHKPGLSISVVEAAAAGKAIITLARKGNLTYGNYFPHQKGIYLVNTVSPDEIAKAMKLLYEDSHLRSTLAYGARQIAEQHFSQKVARKQLEGLFQKISNL